MNCRSSSMFPFLFLFLFSFSWIASADRHEDFLQCLHYQNSNAISKVIYTPINSSYSSVLQFSIRNGRFNTSATPKPLVIVTPLNVAHIQAAIACSQKHGLQIRVRSGGHDYEDRLLSYMQESFPELGLVKEDCIEMSWIESTVYFAQFPRNTSLEVLLNRSPRPTSFFKGKTDFVKEPIPKTALEGIWERLDQVDAGSAELQFTAYGGKMNEIAESSTPFPHRAGTLYQIHYGISWDEEGIEAYAKYISWIRRLYSYMAPYVSKNPRQAYVNYRDLDLGVNNLGNTSYRQASIWGTKYFKNNFDRLVRVKTAVDPANFFRNEQSIPPLSSW
ncbi:hypothetical protein NC653_004581 [Populus alba x Populus x berolinensis]|uniref:Berberine/berberine-like domain-containing protein n=1 Tax=Populus alba x Populus x berolinensis TaxID=444605 RepID=A0AAD6RUP8_9ROSI|nr:hypothetical protein NC653_004581 [Populus alba x Populus x berolinensis]